MNELKKLRPNRPGWFYRWMMAFVGLFDGWLHMSCRSFIRLASEKHERPLSPLERFRQAMHRWICKICRIQENRMDQLRELAQDVGRTSVDEVGAKLTAEITERIRKAMSEAARK